MTEGFPQETFLLNPRTVDERMKFLEEFKPIAWRTYLLRVAAKENALMIDFTKPLKRTDFSVFNGIFDIDAVDFFTATDEDFVHIISSRLRPEED